MRNLYALAILFLSIPAFAGAPKDKAQAKPSSFTTDLSIGQSYTKKCEQAIIEKLDLEMPKGYPSFPGLKEFLTSNRGSIPETCTRRPAQFTVLSREFLSTGTGGGSVEMLYVDSVGCNWDELTSKMYKIRVSFKMEVSPAVVEKITAL